MAHWFPAVLHVSGGVAVTLRAGDSGEHAHPPLLGCWLWKEAENKTGSGGRRMRWRWWGRRCSEQVDKRDSGRLTVNLLLGDTPMPAQMVTCRDRPKESAEPVIR